MSGLTIAKADLSMVPALMKLSTQLGYERTAEEISAQLEKILAREDHIFLVALRGQEVCGWVHFHQVDVLTSPTYVEVAGLVVDQACRKQGVGHALMQAGEAWAEKRNLEVVRVRSNIKREGAHTFYEQMGYTCVKQQKTFSKNLPAKP